MTVTREDYDGWLDHPVTQWLLSAFGTTAGALKEDWIEGAWNSDLLDPVNKAKAFTRWDILDQIATLNYETACDYAGQDIEEDS